MTKVSGATAYYATIAALLIACGTTSAQDLPYGHKEFSPTAARPIGWRADGSGLMPGAHPPLVWHDPDIRAHRSDAITNDRKKPRRNILWKVRTPGYGHCAPIVVGDRVFVTAEPDRLVCLRLTDGKTLWEE